jgi:hypothetical protein
LGQARNDRFERRGIIVPPFLEYLSPEEMFSLREMIRFQIGPVTLETVERAYLFVKEKIISIN